MGVIFRTVPLPLFLHIGSGTLKDLQTVLHEYHLSFDRPLIVSQPNIVEALHLNLPQLFPQGQVDFVSDNTFAEVDRIITLAQKKDNDVIISIGGGRVLDVGKQAGTILRLNYINVPTAPSNDAIASPTAVLKDTEGKSQSIGVNMPLGVLVDLEVMAKAPAHIIAGGIGDLMSNISALKDWKLGQVDKQEVIDDFAYLLSETSVETLFAPYCNLQKITVTEPDFLRRLTQGLVLSGISASIAGTSRPFSGAEHEISHAIDTLFPGTGMHGHQVGYATLLTEEIRGSDWKPLATFFKSVGVPTKYAAFKLTEDQMVKAIQYAPQTRPDRYTILEKLNLPAEKIRQVVRSVEQG
ncbi:MAG: iron-containing alcohol dehydrogenase family protein [Patescibacteria group bacterium]